ncbi:Chk1 protein kinase [Marasmius crinis-equi]|uniref:Chk1 protein kinase n=1 Tax=Marasmius crinis-equi TaxID=585013 RepID=A0ABR3FH05_9AGAR
MLETENRHPGFQIVEEIGGGGFSTVYRAVHIENHRVAACKYIRLTDQTTPKERKDAEKEMRIHSQLKHKHVLEFLDGAVLEPKHATKYLPGFYMMLEIAAGGDLFDKIAPDIGVSDELAHLYFNQLAAGMQYIHGEGVCHRDLKPENILLDFVGDLKICDFGLSAVYKLKQTGQTRSLSEQCGSLPYAAPEINLKGTYSGEAIDVWGMGVILYTLLAGNTPWDEATKSSPEFCAYVDGSIYREDPWNRLGDDAISLLQGLLNTNPSERMTIADASRHPWCLRPSQLARQKPAILAEKLTENLRKNGDMAYAAPALSGVEDVDDDGDSYMHTQFTQSLNLFSQTQTGKRYTRSLTKFYASLGPQLLYDIIQESLLALGVQCKVPKEQTEGKLRLRIGGYDRRKEMFKGWVEVEPFEIRSNQGSFVVLDRDVVSHPYSPVSCSEAN